ncbi:hypothetical protein FDH38_gp003 [Dinoroseobacter phage vB_DshS-R5C]|uniref:Uncharacterized protein n=1 Tax=Dinoroseobacter phage vB_DshS-R5C TaxID=1965368 RepID=A0A1V0DY37_9CAUD|nr:hypothetical protein FDH38_gp003 [Dinoroseobacter phage vB_DshS-R5C]ARB06057.1 hypothetical protein vBDshSR5C_3 [Dinoroseobacter phage vB_DshS-R5C]
MSLEIELRVETKATVEFDREPTDEEWRCILDSIIGQMSENEVLRWLNASEYGRTLKSAFTRSHLRAPMRAGRKASTGSGDDT